MENDNYFKQRNLNNLKKLRNLRKDLPEFCDEFFIGIENSTTLLTRLNYAYDLRIFFFFLTNQIICFNKDVIQFNIDDLNKVTTTHIELFIDFLSCYKFNGKTYTNGSKGKSRKLSTVRTLFKYFYNKNYLATNPTLKCRMPKIHEKDITRLEVDEVVKILNVAENGDGLTKQQYAFHERTYLRDTAILTLFLGTGIRISECVGLNISDIDFNVNGFKVTRKGGAQEILYFSNEVADALKAYLRQRKSNEKIPQDEPALFLSLQNKRISTRAVQNLVKKYSKIISPLKNISPHKLRSTYGTNLYRETGDIYVVAEVLGHKDVNTTKKHYAAMSDEIKRDAARKVVLREKE